MCQDKKIHNKEGKLRTLAGYETIYNDLSKLEGSGGGCYILWVNDSFVTNSDLIPVGVVFLGTYLAHYFCISHLIYSVCRYIFISNDPERFSYCYLLFIDSVVAYTNALTYLS